MIWALLANAILMVVVYAHYQIVKTDNEKRSKFLDLREDEIINFVDDHNRFVDSFDNFYKAKTYQAGLGFLQLKKYQEELLEVLDPSLDSEMMLYLEASNAQLENLLRELSFMSKQTIKTRKEKESMIEKIYFDESKFSKN